ncbi:hypothetical protein ANTQUA_LOCUS6917 [Anthophora quadrimaculata]
MCFRHVLSIEAFENQDSTTVAYSAWCNSRNTAPQVFPIVAEQRTELRLFYLSRTMVVARCASGTCFLQKRSRTRIPPALLTQHGNHGCSEMCFRHVLSTEAFANQDSTSVAYSALDYRRNASIQEFSVVLVLIINMRLFYHSSTMVVARCVSNMCFRIEAFVNQDSTTVAYSTWDYRRNASIQEFSVVIVLRIELRLLYISRTVEIARCSSDTCFRIETFENQHSSTVAYLRWYNSRNTALQLFPVAIELRTEWRLFYLSRTVVAARYVSDAWFRLEAFENQHSTTVAYLTWYISRHTAPQLFPVVVEQRTELRLFNLSRIMVVARCASDTCLRMEALEYQDSTTVAYSTWDYRRNASIQEISVVIVLIIKMPLFRLSSTMVVARCASDTCFL